MKIVKNVVVQGNQGIVGKNTLTSLLTSNSNKLAGRRIIMTKGPDGTTRVITGSNVVPKTLTNQQQSLIKVQTTAGPQQIQTVSGKIFLIFLIYETVL